MLFLVWYISDHIDYLDDVERADINLAFLLCFAWTTPWGVSEVWEGPAGCCSVNSALYFSAFCVDCVGKRMWW